LLFYKLGFYVALFYVSFLYVKSSNLITVDVSSKLRNNHWVI